jgi:hypothetical protein
LLNSYLVSTPEDIAIPTSCMPEKKAKKPFSVSVISPAMHDRIFVIFKAGCGEFECFHRMKPNTTDPIPARAVRNKSAPVPGPRTPAHGPMIEVLAATGITEMGRTQRAMLIPTVVLVFAAFDCSSIKKSSPQKDD